jgi:hypothetical protein
MKTMYQTVINATRASVKAMNSMQKHARAIRDAQRSNDHAAELRATRLYEMARTRWHNARHAAMFPWEG